MLSTAFCEPIFSSKTAVIARVVSDAPKYLAFFKTFARANPFANRSQTYLCLS